MKIKDTLIVLFIVGAMSLVANAIGTKYTIVEAIPGLLFLIFLAIAGVVLAKYLPGRMYPCCCLYRNFGLYPDLSDYARQ